LAARALNKIFRTWKITATKAWNISGELCSGAAIDDSVSIDNLAFNPLIKCDCSFVDSTICRIVALYVSLFSNCLPPVRRFASLEFLCLTGELVVWMLLDRFLMISGLLFTSLICMILHLTKDLHLEHTHSLTRFSFFFFAGT